MAPAAKQGEPDCHTREVLETHRPKTRLDLLENRRSILTKHKPMSPIAVVLWLRIARRKPTKRVGRRPKIPPMRSFELLIKQVS